MWKNRIFLFQNLISFECLQILFKRNPLVECMIVWMQYVSWALMCVWRGTVTASWNGSSCVFTGSQWDTPHRPAWPTRVFPALCPVMAAMHLSLGCLSHLPLLSQKKQQRIHYDVHNEQIQNRECTVFFHFESLLWRNTKIIPLICLIYLNVNIIYEIEGVQTS